MRHASTMQLHVPVPPDGFNVTQFSHALSYVTFRQPFGNVGARRQLPSNGSPFCDAKELSFCISHFRHATYPWEWVWVWYTKKHLLRIPHLVTPLSSFRFRPYARNDLQRLSASCCLLLVALSSVLLRSKTLLSSARAINFEPANPDGTADQLSLDVALSIVIILACLVFPLIVS